MINKKEKYLKNYLNCEKFRESLLKQQNKFFELYNQEIVNNNRVQNSLNKLIPDISNYYNISPKQIINKNINITPEDNSIFKIRLDQTRESLTELSKIKWPNLTVCKNILELKGNVNYTNYIII